MLISQEVCRFIFRAFDKRFYFRDCVVRGRKMFVFTISPKLSREQERIDEENCRDPMLRSKGIVSFFIDTGEWFADFKDNLCWAPRKSRLTSRLAWSGTAICFPGITGHSSREAA